MDEHDYRSLDESLEEKKRNSSIFSDQNKKPFDENDPINGLNQYLKRDGYRNSYRSEESSSLNKSRSSASEEESGFLGDAEFKMNTAQDQMIQLPAILEKKTEVLQNVKKPEEFADLEVEVNEAYKSFFSIKRAAYQMSGDRRFNETYHALGWSQTTKRVKEAEKKKNYNRSVKYYNRSVQQEKERNGGREDPVTDSEVINSVMSLHLEQFRFDTDEEFCANIYTNYALLKHVDAAEELFRLYHENRDANPNLKNMNWENFAKQIAFAKEIREWMDARRELISHPYYVLLSSKEASCYERMLEGMKGKKASVLDKSGFYDANPALVQKVNEDMEKVRGFLKAYEKEQKCRFHRKDARGSARKKTQYEQRFRENISDQRGRNAYNKAVANRTEIQNNRLLEEERQRHRAEDLAKRKDTLKSWDDQIRSWYAGGEEEAAENTFFNEEDFSVLLQSFLTLGPESLHFSTADEILKNLNAHNELFRKSDEMQNLLTQAVMNGTVKQLDAEKIREVRARILLFNDARKKQMGLLEALTNRDPALMENEEKKPEDWALEKGFLLADPKGRMQEMRLELDKEKELCPEKYKSLWKNLLPDRVLNDQDLNAAMKDADKSILFWNTLRNARQSLQMEDRQNTILIKQYIKEQKLTGEDGNRLLNDPALRIHLRGKNRDYKRNLLKLVTEGAADEVSREKARKQIYEGIGKQVEALAGGFVLEDKKESRFLIQLKDKLNLTEMLSLLEPAEGKTEEVRKSNALLAFGKEILCPRMNTLLSLAGEENLPYLSGIRFEDLKELKKNSAVYQKHLDENQAGNEDTLRTKEIFSDVLSLQTTAEEVKDRPQKVKKELLLQTNLDGLLQDYQNAFGVVSEAQKRRRREAEDLSNRSADSAMIKPEELEELRIDCINRLVKDCPDIPEQAYYNVPADQLKSMAISCLLGQWKQEDVKKHLGQLKAQGERKEENASELKWTVSEEDALSLLVNLTEKKQTGASLLSSLKHHRELLASIGNENLVNMERIQSRYQELKERINYTKNQLPSLVYKQEAELWVFEQENDVSKFETDPAVIEEKYQTLRKELLNQIGQFQELENEWMRGTDLKTGVKNLTMSEEQWQNVKPLMDKIDDLEVQRRYLQRKKELSANRKLLADSQNQLAAWEKEAAELEDELLTAEKSKEKDPLAELKGRYASLMNEVKELEELPGKIRTLESAVSDLKEKQKTTPLTKEEEKALSENEKLLARDMERYENANKVDAKYTTHITRLRADAAKCREEIKKEEAKRRKRTGKGQTITIRPDVLNVMKEKLDGPERMLLDRLDGVLSDVADYLKKKTGQKTLTIESVFQGLDEQDTELLKLLEGKADTFEQAVEESYGEIAKTVREATELMYEHKKEVEIKHDLQRFKFDINKEKAAELRGAPFLLKREPKGEKKEKRPLTAEESKTVSLKELVERENDNVAARKLETDKFYEKNPVIVGKEEKENPERETLQDLFDKKWSPEYGEGRFIRIVLNNYFEKSDPKIKHRMLSHMLKELKPQSKDKAHEKTNSLKKAGHYLAGLVKGAGPLLQKEMQSLPKKVLLTELEEAVEDVKSRLDPIPRDYVEKRLSEICETTNGKVTKLTVSRSLGAASVAETFLCNVEGPGIKVGTQVALKLLRPDLKAEMEEEKKLMRYFAAPRELQEGESEENVMKDGGAMLRTYDGMVAKVEEELNLKTEAENAEQGRVYESSEKGAVTAVVHGFDLIPPGQDYMLMDKAEGETVDNITSEAKHFRISTRKQFQNAAGLVYFYGDRRQLIKKSRTDMVKKLNSLKRQYKHLAKLGKLWAQESLYGEGFFHGDMHAGNIMLNDKKCTLLDFGNATNLNTEGDQAQSWIRLMTIAATLNQTGDFLNWFTELLPEDSPSRAILTDEEHKVKRLHIRSRLSEIFKKCGDRPGEKINLALTEMQRQGIEIPATVFNFSKSELRLQNSIDELAREIRLLEGSITELEKAPIPGKVAIVNPVLTVQEAVSTTGADAEGAYKEAINSLMPLNKEEFLRGLTTVNKADREAFIGKYMGTYAELETLQNGEAMDREGLDYRPAADLDTNKLRAEYEKYWNTLNDPNISKEEKRAVKNKPGNVMDIILKGLEESQIYDLLSGYRTAASAFTVCNSAYNPEEFEKLLADLEIAGKMLEVWDKTKKLHALLDDKKTRKEEIESLADAIYTLYSQIDHYKKSQNPLLQNLHGRLYLGIEDQIVVDDSIVGFTLTANYKRLPEDHPTKKLCAPYEKRAQELSAKRKAYKAASWKEKKDNNLKDLTPEEEQEFEEIAKKLKRAVNNVGRWESFERNVKLAEKDLESLFSEKEGGVELKKSYDIFRKIQREYIQKVVCDGKKDDKLEATMKAAEEQFTRIYKDMALRMLTDQAEEFDEKIEDKTEPDDFLAIMNGVVNDKRTVTMLGIPFLSKLKYATLITKDDPNDDSELEEAREELTEEEEEQLKEMERISDGK